jgi:hypothetical protein
MLILSIPQDLGKREWIYLAQHKGHKRALMCAAMKLGFHKMRRIA